MPNDTTFDLDPVAQLRLYKSVIASMAEGIVVQDGGGAIVAANDRALAILGVSLDQLRGRTSTDPEWRCIHADGSPYPGDNHPSMRTLRTCIACENEIMGVHLPSGRLRWISINTHPLLAGTSIDGVVATFVDITAKHISDTKLRHHVTFADVMIDNLTRFATATVDSADQVLSDAMAQVSHCLDCDHLLFVQLSDDQRRMSITHEYCGAGIVSVAAGYQERSVDEFCSAVHTLRDESLVRSLDDITDPHEREVAEHEGAKVMLRVPVTMAGHVRGGLSFHRHATDTLFDAQDERHARLFGRAVGAFIERITAERARHNDMQRRLELEQQLAHAQKLESIGRLAGGVAHDFNNMLTVILSEADLALADMPDPNVPAGVALQEITATARRSAALTRQLLAFARRQASRPEVTELNDKIASTLSMLRRLIGEDIRLDFRPGPGLYPVNIDPSQVDQMMANLVVNARDAMETGGRILIATRQVTLVSAAETRNRLPAGHYCEIEVRDTGSGMSPDVLERIFDPFYTTKESGKGTGLGLSTVYGIVAQNHGAVLVDSTPGVGTTFRLRLPLHTAPAARANDDAAATLPRGDERILIVEDDSMILGLAARILSRQGYRVLTAANLAEALRQMDASTVDLLLSDVVMPDANGHSLVDRLRARQPGLKHLFMTGYPAEVIAQRCGVVDDSHVVQKPFDRASLSRAVRTVLDER